MNPSKVEEQQQQNEYRQPVSSWDCWLCHACDPLVSLIEVNQSRKRQFAACTWRRASGFTTYIHHCQSPSKNAKYTTRYYHSGLISSHLKHDDVCLSSFNIFQLEMSAVTSRDISLSNKTMNEGRPESHFQHPVEGLRNLERPIPASQLTALRTCWSKLEIDVIVNHVNANARQTACMSCWSHNAASSLETAYVHEVEP